MRTHLRGRETIREANTFHGYHRLQPSTLYALHQQGKAAHPVVAFWHLGEIRVLEGPDGKPVLERPVTRLEPLPSQKTFAKEALTVDDACIRLADVKAVEAQSKAQSKPWRHLPP